MRAKNERIPRAFLAKPKGKRALFRFGAMVFLPLIPPRVAVVVSKKTFRKAVSRNRARRRVLHILRELLRGGNITTSIILYPNTNALRAPFSELRQAIAETIARP